MSDLGRRWLVVSPHLDDAILSIGAAIAMNARAGGSTTVVTMLAGDPASAADAGPWDAESGFRSSAEATRARRREDERACRIVGARPVHLDGIDEQYGTTDGEAERWDAVRALAADHDLVFLPGAPLRHQDHHRLAEAGASLLAGSDLRPYGEEPYLLWHHRSPETAALPDGSSIGWERWPCPWTAVARKALATLAYRSQLAQLSARMRRSRYDVPVARMLVRLVRRTRRGEWIATVR